MSSRRRTLGTAVFVAGALAGAALEGLVFRKVFPRAEAVPRAPLPAGGRTRWVRSFDGTRIHATVYGDVDAPRTFVLAHGALETQMVWRYQIDALLTHGDCCVVAYDARGHGGSGPPRGPRRETRLTGYTLARDLAAVVGEITKGRVVLVGHSMGGMTIQGLWQFGEIVQIAGRVAGIVLVNTTYTADLRGWRGRGSLRERAFERVEDVFQRIPFPPKLVEWARPGTNDLTLLIGRLEYGKEPSLRHVAWSVSMYEEADSETLTAFMDLARFDAHDALSSIDVPALVIAGERDEITPTWLSDEIAAGIPDSELVVFDACGHMAPFERHEEVSLHIAKFADRVFP